MSAIILSARRLNWPVSGAEAPTAGPWTVRDPYYWTVTRGIDIIGGPAHVIVASIPASRTVDNARRLADATAISRLPDLRQAVRDLLATMTRDAPTGRWYPGNGSDKSAEHAAAMDALAALMGGAP